MWRLLAKGAISALLIWLLVRNRDLGALLREMLDVERAPLLAAGLLLFALALPVAQRWSVVLGRLDAPLGFRRSFPICLVGNFFNIALPSSIGGDAMRMWLAFRAGVPGRAAVTSVVIDRLAGVGALLILVAAGLLALLLRGDTPALALGAATLLVLGCCGLGAALLLDRLPARLRRFKPVRSAVQFAAEARAVLLAPATALPVILLSLANQLGYVLVVWLLARGLGLPIDATQCLIVVPFAILAGTLPVSIAGWGMREGAFVAGFGFFGIAAAQALALSVLLGLLTIVVALPGGVVWLLLGGRKAEPHARPAAEPLGRAAGQP
jgi:glycosyltransferase 2 family protein